MKALNRKALQLAAIALFAGPAFAQAHDDHVSRVDKTSSAHKQSTTAERRVTEAVAVVQKLQTDERMRALLGTAKGVFIVPSYGRAAVAVGAEGGTGVLLVHHDDGSWAEPVFYRTGGLSLGLQAGAEGGMLALVLNNDKAVDAFLKKTSVSLNAKTGLTVLNWNKMAQGSTGAGDVVAWADTKGLFGDVATVEVNGIRYDQKLTNAYYHRSLSATDVIGGKTSNPQAEPLVQALAATGPAH